LVCPPVTLRAQLDRLVVLSRLDTVELAVLPFDARLPLSPGHSFWIYDDRLVLVETLTTELSLRDPEDIELYARLFELFWDVSRRGDDAIVLITELLQQLRSIKDNQGEDAVMIAGLLLAARPGRRCCSAWSRSGAQ